MRWRLLALVVLALSALSALAAAYVYRASFTGSLRVEPGAPGMTVAVSENGAFGSVAPGEWSKQLVMTVGNISPETITALYFDMDMPPGVTFYALAPPFAPLLPGTQTSFPVVVHVDEGVATADLTYSGKVIGVR